MLLDFVLQCVFWLFEFYVGFNNFLTEFRNFRLIKFSDNLELSVNLNFRVVSGFGELSGEFATGFHCFSSPIRFWCIFLTVVLIFGHIQFSAATFSRVGLVTKTPDRI